MSRIHCSIGKNAVAVGALAVAFTVGGGVAYSAGLVTSKDIKNDTVRSVDLNVPVGATGEEAAAPVPLTEKPQSVLKAKLVGDDGNGQGLAQAVVEIQNNSGKSAQVVLSLTRVGDPKNSQSFAVFVPVGATTTAPALLGFPTGDQTVVLKASGPSGVTVTSAQLALSAYPTGGGFFKSYPTGGGF